MFDLNKTLRNYSLFHTEFTHVHLVMLLFVDHNDKIYFQICVNNELNLSVKFRINSRNKTCMLSYKCVTQLNGCPASDWNMVQLAGGHSPWPASGERNDPSGTISPRDRNEEYNAYNL